MLYILKKPFKTCPIFQKRGRFINGDPIYKYSKLSRYLLNLTFLKNHFGPYSAHAESTALLYRRLLTFCVENRFLKDMNFYFAHLSNYKSSRDL